MNRKILGMDFKLKNSIKFASRSNLCQDFPNRSLVYSRSTLAPNQMLRLSLPKLHFVFLRGCGDAINESNFEGFFVFIKLTSNFYAPFPLPNSDELGNVCMGKLNKHRGFKPRLDSMSNLADYFWNSTFTQPPDLGIFVNQDLFIDSLGQWHDLTQQNPNFMREQLVISDFIKNCEFVYEMKRGVANFWWNASRHYRLLNEYDAPAFMSE